jgi:perosamine synthetase
MFQPFVSEHAIERVVRTLRSGWIGEGPAVKEFEAHVGAMVGNRHAVAVNSGTAALHVALIVAGVRAGDEVITTAQTMLATTQAILAVGATPVYADVQYLTGNLDPKSVARRITPCARAILAVDWAGYPCDWDDLQALGREHGLSVIEDAAHALGAMYRGRPVGSVVGFTCFSFQAIKHLTTGDGGMLLVSKEEDYVRARRLRWFGIDRERREPSLLGEPLWNVRELGYKYHMNDVAASIGLGNLQEFEKNLMRRRQIAATYRRHLEGIAGITLLALKGDRVSADWLFSLHVEKRDDFCRMMRSKEIEVSVVHQRIDRNALYGGERSDLPELTRFTSTHICLPLHPRLSDEDVRLVIDSVRGGW